MNSSPESEDASNIVLSQKDVDGIGRVREALKQADRRDVWKNMEDRILCGRRVDTNLYHMRIVYGLSLLSRFPALYVDFNGLCHLADVPMSQWRGVRGWFTAFCAKMESIIDVCEASFLRQQDAPIHLRPYGVLIPNPNHASKITVHISTEARYPRPRTLYRLKTASESGLESAIILAEATGLIHESARSVLARVNKEVMKIAMREIFFVLQRLFNLMVACGLRFKETGYEELIKRYLLYLILGFEAFNRLKPNQLKTIKSQTTLKEALETAEKRQLGFIYSFQGDDKWILRCSLCGSHTHVDAPPWPEKRDCRVCGVSLLRLDPR